MRRFAKSILGVTLLEIMLVLAIAAMIIVMSVRYYQSASSNQQANAALEMIQGIAAAADGLAQSTGAYNGATVTTANIQQLMPNNSLGTPWGTTATFTPTSATVYTVSLPNTPAAVCPQLNSRLSANPKYTVTSGACGAAAATFTYTYTSTN